MKRIGMTQTRLAQLVHVTPTMICSILAGRVKPSENLAYRIATALNFQKPSAIFKSMFAADCFDPVAQTEIPRRTPFVEKPPTALDEAKRIFRENEAALTEEQCRLLAASMGLPPFRLFADRFDKMGNLIAQPVEVSNG